MKHPTTRQLYAYWTQRRGVRAAPDRGDIEPAAIRTLLSDSFVLAGDVKDHRFRVAGTGICALFGRELRGEPFASIWDSADARSAHDALMAVVEEGTGFVVGAEAQYGGDAQTASFELLVLPLSYRGVIGARVIGALAALERPPWLEMCTVEPLHFGAVRYLSDAARSSPAPITPAVDPARLRRRFTVIDGGLA